MSDDDEKRRDEKEQDGIDELKSADAKELHRAVREEGESELERPASSLFWSGLASGIAIVTSLIAEGALHNYLPEEPWRPLVTALGYPFGFVIVILGRMQLFTESTITAMLPLITVPCKKSLLRTLRLWAIVITANLIGTCIAAASIDFHLLGDDALRFAMIEVSAKVAELGPLETFINAIPAGFLIAILAWALPNARQQSLLVIFLITYLVGVGGFTHSIVGSSEAFLLMFDGQTGVAQTLFALILPALLGNLVGGAGLFTVLAHGQVQGEMEDFRNRHRDWYQ